jgi:hypothetical protein
MANFRTIGTDFSEGLKAPHYTNGRLLTAEDLQQEQRAGLERLAQTGRAAGYGIVEGFQVTAAAGKTALKVTAGLGLNRLGQVIHLAADSVTLPVQPVASGEEPLRRAGRFEACAEPEGDQPPTTAAGAYLLTAAPLAQLEGFVPRKACDGTSTATCANQWEVEGVEFKIIRLVNYSPPTGNRANRNRNLLAHWFYGSQEITGLMRDPLQFPAAYTGFSDIAADDFTLCDLPLAVFFWANNQIRFIDQWAVRRRLIHPYPSAKWAANISDQRLAEGQARFLQFQEQAADLQAEYGPQTDTLRAVDHFGYLPPVGILPVNPFELIITDIFEATLSEQQMRLIIEFKLTVAQVLERVRTGVLNSLGDKNAFSLEAFFGELLPPEYQIVHEDFVHDRLHQSWVQPPIVLPPPPSPPGLFGLFELVLSDGSLMAVNDDNFAGIVGNLSSKFKGSVFSMSAQPANVAAAAMATMAMATPAAASVTPTVVGPTPGNIAAANLSAANIAEAAGPTAATGNLAAGRLALLANISRFRPPRAIFEPPRRGDGDDVEPMVDILVVDELLDPYRDQLSKSMSGRIDDAIAALTDGGGIFSAVNNYAAVNNSIANAFKLNNFLWQASLAGKADFGQLIKIINKGKTPIFYVVFARRRPPVISRPLRL